MPTRTAWRVRVSIKQTRALGAYFLMLAVFSGRLCGFEMFWFIYIQLF